MIQNRLKDKDKDIRGLKKQTSSLLNCAWEKGYVAGFDDGYKTGRQAEERPKGHWRSVGFEKGYAFCICSECGNITRLYRDSKNEFCCIADIRNKVIACLYCGADMRGDV